MVKSMETIMQQMTLKINNLETKLMEIKTGWRFGSVEKKIPTRKKR